MDSKLTLSVDKKLSEMAKRYARSQGRSLSDLVESYFKILISDQEPSNLELSSKIKSIKGALKVDQDFDYKHELSNALSKKYLK